MSNIDENLKNKSNIFILTGHRKSGTSLFHRLFDGHPGINLYPIDISILYAYFPCFTGNGKLSDEQLRSRLELVLKNSLGTQNEILNQNNTNIDNFIKRINQKVRDDELRDKKIVINAIKEVWSEVTNNNDLPFVFKETSQSLFFQDFKDDFPNLKMVTLIRDPRDNYAAIKAGVEKHYSKFNENEKQSLASVINRVQLDLNSAKLNQKLYPDSFLAIKFEDLVIKTQEVMEQVSKFLDIPFNESLLEPTISGKPYHGNSHDGKSFSGVSSQNLGRWKQRISEEEAMIIEYWLKDSMGYWNYPIEYDIHLSQKKFSKFYEWYNCQYFYHDSFQKP